MNFKSIAIVGLEKNTGKTETFNYVLKHAKNRLLGLTSIGIDGETVDLVTSTSKPEVTVYEGMVFTTSEQHYNSKRLGSEVLSVSERMTSLGRLITARATTESKVILSGPTTNGWLRELIDEQVKYGVETTIVDGALWRKSVASPAITEAMILATGAAVSASIKQVVNKTGFVCELINLNASPYAQELQGIEKGVWSVADNGKTEDLGIESVFLMDEKKARLIETGKRIYVTGALSDKFLEFMCLQKNLKDTTVIVRDFTKMFVSPSVYSSFVRHGGRIEVVDKPKLLALTVNPFSPTGFSVDSDRLVDALKEVIEDVMIFDVRKGLKSFEDEICRG